MADLFDSFDSYIGKLNTSNPDKVMHKLSSDVVNNMNEAAKFQSDVAKGVGTALVGTPGDVEGIGRGAAEAAPVAYQGVMQLLGAATDALGIEGVSNAIKTLYGSEQNRTALEALMDGMSKDTILPTTEDVQGYLSENYGVQFDDNAATFLGYILAPGGYIAKGKQALKAGKEVIEKGVSKISEGLDSAKKSSNSNVITKRFKDRHTKEEVISNIYTKNGVLTDETGSPMNLYHGTKKEFDEFDMSKSNYPVIYFANKEDIAKKYGTIKTVNLKMNKPFVVTDFDFTSGLGEDMGLIYNKIMNKIKNTNNRTNPSNQWMVEPETVKKLKDKGYDGIIVPEEASPRRESYYMVFDPSQIKTKGN